MFLKQGIEPGKPASRGIATDGGVHHTPGFIALDEAFLQQMYPALAGFQPESGADTIADHQYGSGQGSLSPAQQRQGPAFQPPSHRIPS